MSWLSALQRHKAAPTLRLTRVPGYEPMLRSRWFNAKGLQSHLAAVELFAGDRAAEELEGCPGCGPLPIVRTKGLKLPLFA